MNELTEMCPVLFSALDASICVSFDSLYLFPSSSSVSSSSSFSLALVWAP